VQAILGTLLLAAGTAAPAQTGTAPALPAPVREALASAGLPEDSIAVLAERLSDGRPLLSHQPDRSLQTASTMKLLTTAVALERLGPGYRGRSELRSDAQIINGILGGNLVLRGAADGDLDVEAFTRLLRDLRREGVHTIVGDLVIDRGFFSPPRPDLGVPPFDETPEFRYNVIPDAALLNNNLFEIALRSFTVPEGGDRLQVDMVPALDGVTLVATMDFVDAPCKDWEDGWKPPYIAAAGDGNLRVVIHGSFPRNCSATTRINVLDRNEYIVRLFRPLWRSFGGQLLGSVRETPGAGGSATRVLAEHRSRLLPEIVRDINKPSDNALTRSLYLTLGALAPDWVPPGSTAERADRVVRAWLRERGIVDDSLVLDNGSGLSRIERLPPRLLVGVLRHMNQSILAPEYLASLPIAGVDGTLRNRLRDSTVAGRARLKTGTLRDVVAVAGYVPNADGEMHAVVALINHPLARHEVARPVVDALIDWIGRQPAPPAPTWWQRLFGSTPR